MRIIFNKISLRKGIITNIIKIHKINIKTEIKNLIKINNNFKMRIIIHQKNNILIIITSKIPKNL